MRRLSIVAGVLLTTACGSDAESSPTGGYPQPEQESTVGSTTSGGASMSASASASMGGQASTSMSMASAEVSASSGGIQGQTASTFGTAAGQASTRVGAAGGQTSTDFGTTNTQSSTATATTGATERPTLSFATDIWPLWTMVRDPVFVYRGMGSYTGCTDVGVCHGGANPGAGLRMPDQETAYAQMIDTPSVSSLCAGTQRVVVGDPENSCLVLFYQGRLGNDDLGWVDDAEIELMREWIRQGALP